MDLILATSALTWLANDTDSDCSSPTSPGRRFSLIRCFQAANISLVRLRRRQRKSIAPTTVMPIKPPITPPTTPHMLTCWALLLVWPCGSELEEL